MDIESDSTAVTDSVKANILDLYVTKFWGMKFATDAANTVLNVDQVGSFADLGCKIVWRIVGVR